ncbi:hypothetical protein EDEG_01891 [Edhazardia aedis USNM 41457]|uniref:Uncharacterized protein n=1 Tax=Edhazardia aedis (strain USNM 41457) TaxID=1003232 RepID=J9D8F2_EDHAE|nr:hypothetical protein EDEG_01891 [Edhazardia aedis USNM 41457]|eukprot:EJW03799.1 hypothetical protein EDEG_01891 [Edhazardia aedis USNM 41457]
MFLFFILALSKNNEFQIRKAYSELYLNINSKDKTSLVFGKNDTETFTTKSIIGTKGKIIKPIGIDMCVTVRKKSMPEEVKKVTKLSSTENFEAISSQQKGDLILQLVLDACDDEKPDSRQIFHIECGNNNGLNQIIYDNLCLTVDDGGDIRFEKCDADNKAQDLKLDIVEAYVPSKKSIEEAKKSSLIDNKKDSDNNLISSCKLIPKDGDFRVHFLKKAFTM